MLGIDRRAGRARHDDAVHALVERRIGQEPALVALAEGRIEVQAVGDFPLDVEAARRGAPTLLVGLGERRALEFGAAKRQCAEEIPAPRGQRSAGTSDVGNKGYRTSKYGGSR